MPSHAASDDSRPVVVAFDGSHEAVEAVRAAATLFRERPILVVTVWEPGMAIGATMPAYELGSAPYPMPTPAEIEAVDKSQLEHATSAAEAGVKLAADLGATAEAVPVADEADVASTLLDVAEQRDAAAVVVGSRGLGRLKSAVLGSTSHRLLHEARRPVVVVRATD